MWGTKNQFIMTLNKTNQSVYLEHANITVNNLKESVRFFKTAFPDFNIRGGDAAQKEWLHIGDDYTYVALEQAVDGIGDKSTKNYGRIGINHLAFVVSDIERLTARLFEAGYKRSYEKAIEEFRIRDYFFDSDGNEFEFIQYLSDKVEERNSFND